MPGAVDEVTAELRRRGDPEKAAFLQRFFRTEPGGYGEGDRFLGTTVPEQRAVARAHRDLPLADVAALLASPLHDVRFVGAVILVERCRRAPAEERPALADFYLAHRAGLNSWDLVDASARQVLGEHLADVGDSAPLDELARAERVWDRRTAIIASWAFTKRGDPSVTLRLAARLLTDSHDLMHKAVGWMLREVGKQEEPALLAFLDRHAGAMPRTALRYATERLAPDTRARYIARGSSVAGAPRARRGSPPPRSRRPPRRAG